MTTEYDDPRASHDKSHCRTCGRNLSFDAHKPDCPWSPWKGIAGSGGSGGAGHDPKNWGDVVVDGKHYSPDMVKALLKEHNELAVQLDETMKEASSLAVSIWRSEFSKDAPEFELCDSARGVISQIDNMYAGVRYQRDKLQQYRNELTATVEALRSAIDSIRTSGKTSGFGVQSPQSVKDSRIAWMKLNEVLATTPQQHLRDVRAESGRAGFIAGYHKMHIDFVGSLAPEESAGFAADQYAERVKAGE